MNDQPVIIIGYSGHAYVVLDALQRSNRTVLGYCDNEEKALNPFNIGYLGRESGLGEQLQQSACFVAIGDNRIRSRISQAIVGAGAHLTNVIHPGASVSATITLGAGILICAGAVINAVATIGNGAVINTSSVIEHECAIGEFVHIAPGAVLCGNVRVGDQSFIGANSVIAQGITIGSNVVIGAGSVVVRNIPDNTTVMGNPAK